MSSTLDNEQLGGLAVGRRAARKQRVNRALLAKMLRERSESNEAEEEDVGEEGGEEDDRKIAKLLISSRVLRRRRTRNLVLAHLLRARSEGEGEEEEGEEGFDEEGGDEDNRLVKAVIASRVLRRRRTRKLVLAHLLRARSEGEGEEEEGDEGFDEEEGGDEGSRLVKAVIASRVLRRRRTRKILLAYLARTRGEGTGEEDFEEDEDTGEEGGDDDNRLVKALIASRVLRRRRARKLMLAHLARTRGGEGTGDEEYEEEEDVGEEGGEDEGRLVRALIGSRVLRKRRARKMLLTHLLRQREEVA